MNNILIVGNIVRDNTTRYTSDGKAIVNNSIAVQRNYKNEKGEYDSDFFAIVAYRGTAEYIDKYISKGDRVAIQGKLRNNNYEKDGQKIYSNEIVIEEIKLCSKAPKKIESAKEEQTVENKSLDDFLG